MTILQAAIKVLQSKGDPMTIAQMAQAIIEAHLYEFKAKSPQSVLSKQIRRHCRGVNVHGAAEIKYFEQVDTHTYQLTEAGRVYTV